MSIAAVMIGTLRVKTLKQLILKMTQLANSTDPDEVAHSTLISVLLLDSTFCLPLLSILLVYLLYFFNYNCKSGCLVIRLLQEKALQC